MIYSVMFITNVSMNKRDVINMVKIIDDGTMGFDAICREGELMADSYECDICCISEDGEEQYFGPSYDEIDEEDE